MDDTDSSSSDEEEIKADGQNVEISLDAPLVNLTVPSAPQFSQKHSHISKSSDSDKDILQSEKNSLQLVMAQPNSTGWVKLSKKKGKKCRLAVTALSG